MSNYSDRLFNSSGHGGMYSRNPMVSPSDLPEEVRREALWAALPSIAQALSSSGGDLGRGLANAAAGMQQGTQGYVSQYLRQLEDEKERRVREMEMANREKEIQYRDQERTRTEAERGASRRALVEGAKRSGLFTPEEFSMFEDPNIPEATLNSLYQQKKEGHAREQTESAQAKEREARIAALVSRGLMTREEAEAMSAEQLGIEVPLRIGEWKAQQKTPDELKRDKQEEASRRFSAGMLQSAAAKYNVDLPEGWQDADNATMMAIHRQILSEHGGGDDTDKAWSRILSTLNVISSDPLWMGKPFEEQVAEAKRRVGATRVASREVVGQGTGASPTGDMAPPQPGSSPGKQPTSEAVEEVVRAGLNSEAFVQAGITEEDWKELRPKIEAGLAAGVSPRDILLGILRHKTGRQEPLGAR